MPVRCSSLLARSVAGLTLVAVAALPSSALAADIPVPSTIANVPDAAQIASTEDEAALDQAAVECMAKVVLHEAANQPRDGQVAVAQTLVNRLGAKRFGGSICEVVNQPGQFFRTASYNPDRDRPGWAAAVEVAQAVLRGDEDDVAPGAMFFRSARQPATSFFRTRTRIASVGQQVFYR